MAVGQGALTPSGRGSGGGSTLDVAALDAAELALEVRAAARCAEHGRLLREVLDLHRVLTAAGAGVSTGPQVALLLQLSETAARTLLAEGQLLTGLPGALEALDCGLLTVEQSATFLRAVGHLDPAVQATVWGRLQTRLLTALDSGTVLTPARLAPLLARWVLAADPSSAEQRRRRAHAAGDVTYRRRDDGVGDLFATGIPAPLLQAVLCRIRDAARPFSSEDDRTAGKRRLDALVDLLLGRRPLHDQHDRAATQDPPAAGPDSAGPGCRTPGAARPACGCPLHSPVPCGADVVVHVPLGGALGTTDELAELVGHGPLHPQQLTDLLIHAPRLTAVHVDQHGTPVALTARTVTVRRGDPTDLRRALLHLATSPPGPRHPRHPFDHPPSSSDRPAPAPPPPHDHPRVRSGTHPPGTPGPYRLTRRLRRLVQLRSPRCEWPACGARADRCDLDHDHPWPAGPTCACNLGPLCRHHHRLKQLLMLKTRTPTGAVTWTCPTGRTWTSPAQHLEPAAPVRALPALPADEPHVLSPTALAELLAPDDDDPIRLELRTPDHDPHEPDHDPVAARLATDHHNWDLALDDPYRWAA